MNTMIKNAAAAIALAAIPGTALAGSGDNTVAVSYADLNLSTETGVEIFDRRIANAAEIVCGGPAPRETGPAMKVRRCVKETLQNVQPDRNLAVLSFGTNRLAKSERKIRFAAKQ